jgi:hypothetical protein
MSIVRWVLFLYLMAVITAAAILCGFYSVHYLSQPSCKASKDVKREIHEVYPLLQE